MYKFDEVNIFLRGPNKIIKNRTFPVKKIRSKFIYEICKNRILRRACIN